MQLTNNNSFCLIQNEQSAEVETHPNNIWNEHS